jgi:hypothetical protein
MSSSYQPSTRYPSHLGALIAQADQLARALQSLCGDSVASDPSHLWLLGRGDEVRAFVDEIVREWSDGSLDTARACGAIRSYVGATHLALHRRYGGYGACCCSPHLEPFPGPRPAVDGGMRPRFKSGVLASKPAATVPARRRQAG